MPQTTTTPEVPITPPPPEVPIVPTVPEIPARNAEIRSLVRAAHLEHTVADRLIDRGASVDEARRELFELPNP